MTYRLFLFFIFIILLDYFILPPLLGLRESFLVVVFLAALIAVVNDYNTILIIGLTASFAGELFGSFSFGVFILPFVLTFAIYIWLDRFLNLRPSLHRQDKAAYGIFTKLTSIICLVYIFYAMFFITQKLFYYTSLQWSRVAPALYDYRLLATISIQSLLMLLLFEYAKYPLKNIYSRDKFYARL